jgi:nucleotide-binding universal stress UspA family protein
MVENKSIKNIMIAIDGSEHSLAAVKLVSDLPGQILPGGEQSLVTALGVLRICNASDYYASMLPIKQARKILEGKGYRVVIDQILGYPAEVITEYAETHRIDLIVLGAKGLRATFGILLGGVAQQVVEYACCPTLVVRSPYHGVKRVLLAIDGSECSQYATHFMAKFPLPPDTELVVIHILPPAPILKTDYIIRTWDIPEEVIQDYTTMLNKENQRKYEDEKEKGEEYLSQSIQVLKSSAFNITSKLLRGDAATEIIDFAKKSDIDLIVAGSRGISQMQSWLVGSVSRKLVHYAPCSVLLVKKTLNIKKNI